LPILPWYLLARTLRRATSTLVFGTYRGIRIADYTWRGGGEAESTAAFVRLVTDALALIEQTDPRRFRLLQREVEFVANEMTHSGSSGAYWRGARRCQIDFDREFGHRDLAENYEWWVAQIASLMVHEATHGRIYSHGVPYTWKNRARVERACHREQQRFAKRLRSDRYAFDEHFLPPFDASDWTPSWTFHDLTGWRRARSYARRSWERYRAARREDINRTTLRGDSCAET